jgi:hypothetical protein
MQILQFFKSAKNCLILGLAVLIILQFIALHGMFKIHKIMDRANDKSFIVAIRCLQELSLERNAR